MRIFFAEGLRSGRRRVGGPGSTGDFVLFRGAELFLFWIFAFVLSPKRAEFFISFCFRSGRRQAEPRGRPLTPGLADPLGSEDGRVHSPDTVFPPDAGLAISVVEAANQSAKACAGGTLLE